MSGKLGMIASEVKHLGKSLKSDADQLTDIAQQVTRQLNSTYWQGPDAERFKSDWQGQHKVELKRVAAALEDFGQLATKNAEQQEKASN